MKKSLLMFTALALVMSSTNAHEFIVKPAAPALTKGSSVDVAIYATETYIQAHRLPPESTQLRLIQGNEQTAVTVKADAEAKVMRATLAAPNDKGFILSGSSLREREDKKSQKDTAANPPVLRMETFSKAFVNLRKKDDIYAQTINTKLEVIPLQNPAELAPGDELKVKILLDGKPLAARVQATYDGFSDKPHGYVVRTESNAQGEAAIPLGASGLWLVRTKYTSDSGGDGFDLYEASANIVFYLNENK